MKKHLSDFWKSTLSNTLGTIIGIVVTFGTTLALQRCEQKNTERTAALMVIHNLDYYCESLEENINDLMVSDSIIGVVWNQWYDNQLTKDTLRIPEDTLRQFLDILLYRHYDCSDNSVETIFSSNIETWTSIGNSEFIEITGKCFATKHLIEKMQAEMDEEIRQNYYTVRTAFLFSDNPSQSPRESVERVFHTPEFCCFLLKLHEMYLPTMQMGLMVIREHNEKNKQLMHVSDDELKQFGFNEHKTYSMKQN